jgi:hypothetical protein
MAFAVNAYVEARQAAGADVPVLDIALGLANYVIGALLAAFLLAWLPTRINGYGLLWAAPLSILLVFACRSHDATLPSSLADFASGAATSYPYLAAMTVAAFALVGTWCICALLGDPHRRAARLGRTAWLIGGAAMLPLISAFGWFAGAVDPATGSVTKVSIAWPWYAPVGALTALVFGYVLADARRDRTEADNTKSDSMP